MDRPRDYHISVEVRKINTIRYYMRNLSYKTNKHICEIETGSFIYRTDLCFPSWHGKGGGKDWEFGICGFKPLYKRWINNKVLLYSTGNYIQYPVISHNGKEYICTTELLCCATEIRHNAVNQLYFDKITKNNKSVFFWHRQLKKSDSDIIGIQGLIAIIANVKNYTYILEMKMWKDKSVIFQITLLVFFPNSIGLLFSLPLLGTAIYSLDV